jgi:hypothetical protein
LHRLGQVRRLAGGETHRPAPGVGDQRVSAAFLGAAAFAVVALREGFRPAVGHEMIVDVVDTGAFAGGGEHPGRQPALAGRHVGTVGDLGQPGPQRPQFRAGGRCDQRPGLAADQRLDTLDRADPAQQRQHRERGQLGLVEAPPRRPVQTSQDFPGPGPVQIGVGQHRPGVAAGIGTATQPDTHSRTDQPTGRPQHNLSPGNRPRRCNRPRLPGQLLLLLFWSHRPRLCGQPRQLGQLLLLLF